MPTTEKVDIALLKRLMHGIREANTKVSQYEQLISTYLQQLVREVLASGEALTPDEIRGACESRSLDLLTVGLTFWHYQRAIQDLEKEGGIKKVPLESLKDADKPDRYISVES